MSSADSNSQIVISGIGLVTPLGSSRSSTWANLLAGNCGLRKLTRTDRQQLAPMISADDWPPSVWGGVCEHPQTHANLAITENRTSAFLRAAAAEAWNDAALENNSVPAHRRACVIGSSKGSFEQLTRQWQGLSERSHSPTTRDQAVPNESTEKPVRAELLDGWPWCFPSTAAHELAARYHCQAAAIAPVAACATGLVCAIYGSDLLRRGLCDLVLVGSVDTSLHPLLLSSFKRLGVLASTADEHSDTDCPARPFDRSRGGFLVGEGAAVLVFERAASARERGVQPYAEWSGGALGSDVGGMTAITPEGHATAEVIRLAMTQAGIFADAVDYINYHGTGTTLNDAAESRAVQQVFGESPTLVGSSLKGSLGHLLGAAGSVELALTAMAVRHQVSPPTVGLQTAGEDCPLNYLAPDEIAGSLPLQTGSRRIRHALKLSLGFGGHIAAAILRRLETP